jgi:hypothetical protein
VIQREIIFAVVKMGHLISPMPRYNSSYLNGKKSDFGFKSTNPGVIGANILSPGGKSNRLSRAGASILNNSNGNFQFAQSSNSHLLPNSFKTALEQVEDEIIALAAEVATSRKDCHILKSEQDTIVDVAKA